MKQHLFKLFIALCLLLHFRNASAVTKDTIVFRYAADTLQPGQPHTTLLVKFSNVPNTSSLSKYGLLKVLTSQHYILQRLPEDSAITKKIVYCYHANANWKASTMLLRQLEKLGSKDSITAQISYTKEYASLSYIRTIQNLGEYHTALIRLRKLDWPRLIADKTITTADALRKPSTEVIINAYNPYINRINIVQQQYPFITGKSITVSLKEDFFDTTDIDLKGAYLPTPGNSTNVTGHATQMATLIAGAGNSGSSSLGVVPGARLSSINFNGLSAYFPDTSVYFQRYNITAQNHSYGIDIDNNYSAGAAAYDQQVYIADTIVHVFSSGNSGMAASDAGLYKGIAGFANLSMNTKHAKNIIVVGGTDAAGFLTTGIQSSCKGPAYDGRIKPDFTAFGQSGTSDASALTTGVSALLQDAYRQRFSKAPSAALIKSLLINSTILPEGITPGYGYGFGNMHALNAMKTIQENRFRQGTLNSNASSSYDITVPAGIRQAKVTLCWNDPPAVENAAKALLNDLDITVTTADGKVWLPWVLSTYPSADSLRKPARRGTDSLNNTEQVTIDLPPAGNLHITISSKRLVTPSQTFYIAWSLLSQQSFQWQNPLPGSILLAGNPVPLQWETSYSGNGDISYSTDSINWQPIAQQVPAQLQISEWNVPDLFSKAWVKLTLKDTSFTSPAFYISPRVNLQVGFNCTDTVMLFWQGLAGAKAYQVYSIQNNILTSYSQPRDTFIFIPKKAINSLYVAISPIAQAGWEGARSNTLNYTTQGVSCYVQNLLADRTTDNKVQLTLSVATGYNLKNIYWERRSGQNWTQLGSQPVNNSLTYYLTDAQPFEGIIHYRVRLETLDGRIFYSDEVMVNILIESDILMFPNPVRDQLYVLAKEPGEKQLLITDMSGRRVMQRTITDVQETIPVQLLANGVYYCSIFSGNKKIFSAKFIKVN
ncbi:MAG TPA: S8 family peptidase [Chitinophaga sp.]|uniref:S8 family peptidase n=1 Tax=Chitinophaga sp. TaxID=1869181 RepID=UPI002CE98159|nr:S8 family peptidase [Chitinophaga sp.]HVI43380.1 S8 family peptidase [Chitinophaga sp.]